MLGFISTWVPTDEYILKEESWWIRILASGLILFAVWIVCFIVSAAAVCIRKRVEAFQTGQGHHVYVQYGDFFDANLVNHPEKRRNLVLAVNRCFDTIVDDDLIRSGSLHGQVIKRICGTGEYSWDTLNTLLQNKLKGQGDAAVQLESYQKRKGNLLRYSPGTIVEFELSDKECYFLVGFTWLDESLHAQYSEEDFQITMIKILEYCQKRSQGYPLVIPLIGSMTAGATGYARADILQYLVKFLKLNEKLINSDIYIVVSEEDRNSIPIILGGHP